MSIAELFYAKQTAKQAERAGIFGFPRRRPRPFPRRRKIQLEPLEPRLLLANDPILGSLNPTGVLTLELTPNPDSVLIRPVSTNPDGSEILDVTSGAVTQRYGGPATGVRAIYGDAQGGNDRIDLTGVSSPATLIGGVGDDTLIGGLGNDVLEGGSGSDRLVGEAGNDTFKARAGEGRDVIEGGAGSDGLRLTGTAGADRIKASASGTHVSLVQTMPVPGVLDLAGIEHLSLDSRGGPDTIAVGDLRGTGLLAVEVDAGSGNDLIDSRGASASVPVTLRGSAGSDTLLGPARDATWTLSGSDTGGVGQVAFSGIENLRGAAGNRDTFVLEQTGQVNGIVDGGPGGFDSLILNGSFDTIVFTPSGPDSGTVARDGDVITYVGLEPVSNAGTATDVVFNGTEATDNWVLEDSLTPGQIQIRGDAIETTSFNNPSTLTLNLGAGADALVINPLGDSGFNGGVTVNAGDGGDSIAVNAVTGSGAYTVNGDRGGDTFTVGGIAGKSVTLTGGAGDDTYHFGNNWGDVTIGDAGGLAFLDFAGFSGDLRLRAPSPTESEVEGIVAGIVTSTVNYSGGATFITNRTILATSVEEGALTDGLSALSDLGDELGQLGKLDTPLSPYATAGMTLGEVLDIGGFLRAHLLQQVENYLAVDSDHTLDELVGILDQSGTLGNLQYSVDAAGTLAGGVLTIDLSLNAARTVTGIDLALGPEVEEFLVAEALTGALTATLGWNFSVGVDAAGDFFGNFPTDMTVSAEINLAPDATFAAHRGFLGLDVTSLGVDGDNTALRILNADLTVDTCGLDTGNDGSVSLVELQNPVTGNLTQTGSAKVGFNLGVLPTTGVQGVGPASLTFQDDLFDGIDPSAPVTSGLDGSYADFDNTDAGSVLAVFQQFGKALGIFGTKALNLPIALTDGQTVSDLFDLGALFQQQVLDRIEQQPHTESTPVSALNRGRGVRTMTGLPDMEVQLSNGTSTFQVNLDHDPATATLGDLMQRIRDAAATAGLNSSQFEVGIDARRGGLGLVDKTGGAGEFKVVALNFSPALSDLGLEGQSAETESDGGTALVIAANIGFPGPSFDTLQEMLGALGPLWVNGPSVYDGSSHGLRFDLGVDLSGTPVADAAMAFFDMGPLSDLVTTSTVDLAPSGTLTLPLALLLTPVGFASPLSETTDLPLLNAGDGIRTNKLKTIESTVAGASNPAPGIGQLVAADVFGGNDSLLGRKVTITSGAALGEIRTIVANTSNTLTLDGGWTAPAAPASGDSFLIDGADVMVFLRDGTVFTVELDGVPLATVGDVRALFQAAGSPGFDIRIAEDRLIPVDRTTPLAPITGTATSAATDSDLEDATAPFGATDSLAGRTVEITAGAGSGQTRRIIGNTATTLTVEFEWDTPLDTDSEYTVFSTFEVLAINDSPARNDLGLISAGSEQVLTADTLVSDANGLQGLGTNGTSSTDIRITLSNGGRLEVDLDVLPVNATMGDLMQRIQNAASAAGVSSAQFEAWVDPGTGRLSLVDRTGTSGFSVSDINGATAASDLGLAGATPVVRDVDHDGVNEYAIDFPAGPAFSMEGNVLHGDTASAHMGVHLDGDASLTTSNLALNVALDDAGGIDVTAGLWGVLGVIAAGGDLVSGSVDVDVEFADPGTDAGTANLLTFREFNESMGEVADLIETQTAGGFFELELPLLPSPGFAGVTGPAATLNVALPDMTNLGTLALSFTETNPVQGLLEAMHDLTIGEVVAALGDAADYLILLQDQALLGGQDNLLSTRLPGLDRSLSQILNFGQGFKDQIATLADGVADPQKLQDLQGALNALSDLSATLAFDTSSSALTVHLTYAPSVTTQVPFRLDLTKLGVDLATPGLDTIGAIQDWKNTDPVTVTASATIDFDLVIDLQAADSSDPLGARNETPYIDGMNSTFDIQVDDSDLNFPAPLGSLSVDIVGGSFVLDEDGSGPGTDPATFTVSLPSGLHSIADGTAIGAVVNATSVALAGALDIVLPMLFPEEIPPDQEPVLVTITDLGDAANTTSLSGPPVRTLQGLVSLLDNLDGFPGTFAGLFSRLDAAFDEAIFSHALPLVGSQLAEAVDFIEQIRDKVLDNLTLITPGLTPGDVQQALFEALGPGGLGWLADRDGNLYRNLDDIDIPILTDTQVEFALDLVIPTQRLATPIDLDLALPGLGLDVEALVDVVFGLADGDASTAQGDPLTLVFGMSGAGAYIRPSSFSQAEFDIDVALRSQVALADNPSLTFKDNGTAGPDTITRDTGSYILDGFKVGQIITVGPTPGGNQGEYEISAIDPFGLTLTLAPGNDLTTEGPVDDIGIEVKKVSLTGNPNLTFKDNFVDTTVPGTTQTTRTYLLDTITRDAGSWILDGFRRGQTITIANAGGNSGSHEILRIDPTGTTLFLGPSSLSNAGPAGGITVRSNGLQGFGAKLGFLPFRVFDLSDVNPAVTSPTGLSGIYTISLNDTSGSTDDRLFATDLTGGVVTASLEGSADINLRLQTDLPDGAAFPPYRMDLLVDWAYADTGAAIGDSYPTLVKFDKVQFELVGFMRDFIGSALSRLDIAFDPMDGLVDFLNSAVFPILSLFFGRAPYATAASFHGGQSEIGDFAGASEIINRLVNGGDVVTDLGDSFNPINKARVPQDLIWEGGFFENAPADVQSVVGLDYLSGQAWIDLGSFEIDPMAARDHTVAEDGPPIPTNVSARAFGKLDDNPGTILGDIRHIARTQSTGPGDAALGFMATQLLPGRTKAIGDIFGGAIRFFFKGTDPIEVPILNDPSAGTAAQSFDLILGHTVIGDATNEESSRLLKYGTPELSVMLYQDIPLSKKEIAKKVFKSGALGEALTVFGVDIYAYLAIAFEARADFQIEYDTTGLTTYAATGNPYDIVDGLFFDDAEGVDQRSITGGAFSALHDEDQARILGGLGLGVAIQFNISILKLKLGIEGIVFIGEGRDFNDPNDDLKLRAHEFDALLLADPAPLRSFQDNIYNIGIASEFRLDIFAKVFLEFFFFKLTIIDLRLNLLTLQPPNIPLPSTSVILPELATASGSDLILATGDNDPKTIYVGFDEASSQFIVSRMSYGSSYNYDTQQFTVSSPDPGNTYGRNYFKTYSATGIQRIVGTGGTAGDTIIISPEVAVPVEFHGGAGNDVLIGGGGPATLYGEDGEDYLQAGSRGGTFDGGSGNDTIHGGDAVDIIHGGLGDDRLLGWRGDDAIHGDEGQDLIDGGSGADYLHGGSGNDVILGRLDDDEIHGGGGDDVIEGGDGPDRIFGDEDNDLVRGGDGNDEIDGGDGADTLFGDQHNDLIYGGADNDWIDGGGGADVVFGDSGPKPASGPDGRDVIVSRQGNDFLDGEGEDDSYLVYFEGGLTASLVTVLDTGPQGDSDVFVATGTIFDDQFLLRANTDGSLAFVAMLNDPVDKVERINYTGVERIVVNAGDGKDHFAVDDTAAEVTLNGEAGDDSFQIGQIFRSERTQVPANVSVEDEFATIETTRGFLSNGISAPMTINGGTGVDTFVVFHNRAVLTLNGDEGDDVFEVRAFALAGSREPRRARTDISGGAGADLVQYAVNAPVNIDGGDGRDTLVVFGTEFGDDFVITDDGVFGAGLTINFVNIELLTVEGAEGDDRFFVKSTSEKFVTELFGGLGSDTFNMSGDTPPVVSNDLRGHSGIVLHDVESNDPLFDGQKVFGISANVADNDEPFVVIRQTDGSTIITEGGSLIDTYEVVLTHQPDTDVFVKALAPIPSPDQRELRARAFRLSSPSPAAVTTPDGTALTLMFTPADWFVPQVVEVRADGAIMQDGAGLFTRPELGDSPSFDFDDDADEGVQFGVINHLVLAGSRSVQGYPVALTPSPTLTIPIPAGANLSAYLPSRLVGRTVAITSGEGSGQERVVAAADIDAAAGEITLILDRAWLVTAVPTTGSGFELRLDSGDVTGIAIAVTNPTITISDPGAITAAELLGRKVEIVSGSGAGQSRFVVGALDQGDGSFTLTLDRGWRVTDLPTAGSLSEQSQTQTGDVFHSNVLTFDFDADALPPMGGGVITVSAIADLDLRSEFLTLNAEGVFSQDLFATGGRQYSPVTTTVNLTQAQLQALAYDGKITFTVTPSNQVNDLSSAYGYPSELTLQLTFPVPDSEFLVRIDDAVVGTMTAFDEGAFSDPEDDRSTFSDGKASFPTAGEGLTGAILQIVGGPGAGQQRLILGNLDSDPTHALILNGPWRTDPAPGQSVYRIERYDGLAIPSVQVQVNDNDAAGLTLDETQGFENTDATLDASDAADDFDTITAVIEGGDGDHLGEKDVLQVRLSRDPGATGVNVNLLFDGSQLELTDLSGTPIASLQFTSDNWSDVQTVVVAAQDDLLREGFHTGLIEFQITAGEGDVTRTQTDPFEDIPKDEAVFFVGLSHQPLEGTVVVTLNGNPLTEDTDYLVKGNKVIFLDADGERMTRSGQIVATYNYTRPGFLGSFTTPVLVRINDNDAPTVLVRETDGSTDVIEALPQATADIELLSNGSFETGFSGWTTNTSGSPFMPWAVTGGGAGSGFGMAPISPQDGSSAAWNGFDGNGPMEFCMFQDVTISAGAAATLTWQDRVQWNFGLGGPATQPRRYEVEVRDPSAGAVLDTLYSFETGVESSANLVGDTGWQTHTADLSEFAGQTIRLFFRQQIPQSFTGPGQIEFDAISLTETVAATSEDDTYELVLTGQPTDEVTVTVTPDITKTTRTGGIRHDEVQVQVSSTDSRVTDNGDGTLTVTFNGQNWDDPVLIAVKAIDDDFVDGGDTQVFAPGPNSVSGILGPVFVEGGGGQGSLGMGPPVMLPGETNVKEKTGDVVSVSGTEVTVTTADLVAVLPTLGLTDISELVDKTIEITAVTDLDNPTHSAIGQFRLITNVAFGQSQTALTISEAYSLQPGESESDILSYAITAESLNFFVDESTRVDYMFVHDEDSPADSSGVLTSTRLSGLNMGPDLVIAGQKWPGGITYGDLEVLEINLGTGGNNFEVLGTHTREDGYQTWTFLNTGDDIPFRGIVGDTATVVLNKEQEVSATGSVSTAQNPGSGPGIFETTVTIDQGFADGVLAGQLIRVVQEGGAQAHVQTRRILGNAGAVLTVDRPWELLPDGGAYEIINEADGALVVNTQGGDDIVDASDSSLPLIIFGGHGSDFVTGGLGKDLILGDSGRVDSFDETGRIVTRLGMIRDDTLGNSQPNTGFVDTAATNTLVDYDVSFPTEDGGLAGLTINIINGRGAPQERRIISNDEHTIVVDSDWGEGETPDNSSQYRISFIPEDQTDGVVRDPLFLITTPSGLAGDDTVFGGPDEDVLMGGDGDDSIDGGSGRDLMFGDNVGLDRRYHDSNGEMIPSPDFTSPRFRALPGVVIYGPDGPDLVDDGTDYPDPTGVSPWHTWDIFMDDAWRFDSYGDDYIAGGADSDVIFGQLGDDTIQGDGSIASKVYGGTPVGAWRDPDGTLHVSAPPEASSDGDDYIEGNGGDDVIFGNLGQDDVVGGYSSLFSLTTLDRRPDGSDLLFGGGGEDILLGDSGDITRACNSDGTPRLNPDGSWHRDVLLIDRATITGRVDLDGLTWTALDRALAEAIVRADLLLLAGAYDADGSPHLLPQQPASCWHPRYEWDTELLLLTLLPDGDDVLDGGSGDDALYGQRGDDTLAGGAGEDFLAGGTGHDRLDGGGEADWLVGDQGTVLTEDGAFPSVAQALQLLPGGSGAEAGISLGGRGTTLLPVATVVPGHDVDPAQGALAQLHGVPGGPRDNTLQRADGTRLVPFATLVPGFAGHLGLVAGNDTLLGGPGDDVLTGDNAAVLAPSLTFSNALMEHALSVTADFLDVADDLADLVHVLHYEVGDVDTCLPLWGESVVVDQTLSIGNDVLDGGAGNDSLTGDDRTAIATALTVTVGQLDSLEALVAGFDHIEAELEGAGREFIDVEHHLRDEVAQIQCGKYWKPALVHHIDRLLLGNDQLTGGEGKDLLVGDQQLHMAPTVTVVAGGARPHGPDHRWHDDDWYDGDHHHHRSWHTDFWRGHDHNRWTSGAGDIVHLGGDTLEGGVGEDLLYGDSLALDAPAVGVDGSVSRWDAGRAEHEAEKVLTELAELGHHHRHHGWFHHHADAPQDGYQITGGSDLLMGGDGSDLLFGQGDRDTLDGGAGADWLVGGRDRDTLYRGVNWKEDKLRSGDDHSQDLREELQGRLIDWSGQYKGFGSSAGLGFPSPWVEPFELQIADHYEEDNAVFVLMPQPTRRRC